MKPKHQAIVAGLALSLTLGVAAPIPMFAQTDTVQQQDIAGNANADPITDVDAKQPAPSDYDPADEYSEAVDPSSLMTLSFNSMMATSSSSLQPKALSSEMKYFAQNESGSNYNLGFSYGDGYHAMGFYQFDRRYALVDFMQECYNYNPQKYGMFKAVIDRDRELKRDADDVIYDKKTHKLTELGQLAEDAWHAAYAADPQEFSALQDAYGYQEYYLPVERIVRKYGLDLSGRADCLKGLCWGMNNLFGSGGCQKFFKMANLSNDMSDEQAVTAICDAASYANRYEREKKTCLTYLAQHKTENDANKDTAGSGSDAGLDSGNGSASDTGTDSGNGSGSGTGSDSGTGSGSGSTDQPSQGEGSVGGGSSAAGGTVTTPAGGSTTGSTNAPSTDTGAGSTSSPDAGNGADSGNGSTSGGSSSSNAPSGTPSDSAAGSNGSADAGGDSGDDAGDANDGATSGDTSDNGASSDAGTQGSGSTSLPSTGEKPDGGKDSTDSKDDGSKGQGDKSADSQGKAKAGADKADTKSDEVEKLPATADASTIGLVVSAALSLSGVGAVAVGKRHSAEKVPFEDGFRG